MNNDDAFRRFLERATEDPVDVGVDTPAWEVTRPGRRHAGVLAGALVAAAAVVAAIAMVGRHDGPQVSAGPTGAPPAPVLVVTADDIPVGSTDGVEFAPTTGPTMRVEVAGEGGVEAAGDGRRFLRGGQQRDDHAIVTLTGDAVPDLVEGDVGRLVVTAIPLVDLAERTTPTGRNIVTFVETTADETDDHLVDGVSLNLDPEIGPYLAGAVRGTRFLHVLDDAEQAWFSAGQPVELSLEWDDGVADVSVNGTVVERFELDQQPPAWTDAARLSIGGSATFGGGYFTMHQDAFVAVELSVAPDGT